MSYNKNTDYSAEIKKAVEGGASAATVKALNDARNEKIAANQSYYNSKGISSNDSWATGAHTYVNSNGEEPVHFSTTNYTGGKTYSTGNNSGGATYTPGANNTVNAPNMNTNSDVGMNTDYQALINRSVANGDMMSAAYYENLRNQKIADSRYTGHQTQTNLYQGYNATKNLDEYIKQMYQAQADSKLAALQSAYEQNRATMEAYGKQIPVTYQAQKNETAGNAAVAQKSFNEMAAANGLNTGTTGQANLASSIALQGNLNKLNTAQTQAESDNALKIANLATEYRSAIVQANSDGNEALAQALQSEYQRQISASQTLAENAQNQRNTTIQMQTQAASENREYAYKTAMAMIQSGIMPSSNLLSQAKISLTDAQRTVNALQMQAAATAAAKATKSSGGSRKSSSKKKSSVSRSTGYTVNTAASTAPHKTDVVKNTNDRQASVNRTQSGYASLGKVAKSLYQQFQGSALTQENKAAMVKSAYKSKHITGKEANTLLDILGF